MMRNRFDKCAGCFCGWEVKSCRVSPGLTKHSNYSACFCSTLIIAGLTLVQTFIIFLHPLNCQKAIFSHRDTCNTQTLSQTGTMKFITIRHLTHVQVHAVFLCFCVVFIPLQYLKQWLYFCVTEVIANDVELHSYPLWKFTVSDGKSCALSHSCYSLLLWENIPSRNNFSLGRHPFKCIQLCV